MSLTGSICKIIEFFKQLFELWSRSNDLKLWMDLWKFDFFKQFVSAVKIFIFSKLLHRRIWFPIFFMKVLSQFLSFETLRFFRFYLRQINSRKNWVFWGSFSSYEKSKYFQLGHRFNRFAKSLSFLTNLSELWMVFKFLSKLPLRLSNGGSSNGGSSFFKLLHSQIWFAKYFCF